MTETELQPTISAYFPTPEGGYLRLVDYHDGDDHRSRVEVAHPEAGAIYRLGRLKEGEETTITLLDTDNSITATKFYNALVEPLIVEELRAAKATRDDAREEGDTITYFAQKEYVEELEADLEWLG